MTYQRHTLICTVGTSLFLNLRRLVAADTDPALAALAQAYAARDWLLVAARLRCLESTARVCGAEINSVTDLLTNQYAENGRLHLLVSETQDGRDIATVLKEYFMKDGWRVDTHEIAGLRDDDPRAFRTRGLRNLAKAIGERVRETGADFCAINATGGYKAQIAIAVLMGQALGIPVYYKHEQFAAIIPFPPMPVSLDFSLWHQASGMFTVLSRPNACEPWERFSDEWDERLEPLVNRETIDGESYLELSAAGQIFHETFRSRFQQSKTTRLPRAATPDERKKPHIGDHDYGQARAPILRYLQHVSSARPYVRRCRSTYWNPGLPESPRFRVSDGHVQGIYSNGSWCVKFKVVTTADDQQDANVVAADLNDWLEANAQ